MKKMTISEVTFDQLLQGIFKPARYIGKEIHTITKDPLDLKLRRMALVYPDLYDLGMANLSLKILYHMINSRPLWAAERSFLPDLDMIKNLKKKKSPLFSLENRIPLNRFDLVGITIQTELTLSNIPELLSLSRIPILAKKRKKNHPLVIGGGPCLSNPEPFADFFDLFLLGDAEAALPELLDLYEKTSQRKKFLLRASSIKGIYVPFQGKKKVQPALIPDLEETDFPVQQIVPLMNIPQNRAVVEVARGCGNNCRFCQAGYFYRPVRERSPECLLKLTEQIIRSTGQTQISLLSLSISNYRNLGFVLKKLNKTLYDYHTSLSLPSIRIDAFGLDILSQYEGKKKTGLTFALESLSPSIRKFLNKEVNDNNFLTILETALNKGWKKVKLYLMYGFPYEYETKENIQGLLSLAGRIRNISRRTDITVHLSPFVPKAGTPFQWMKQKSTKELEKLLQQYKQGLRIRNLKLKWHNLNMSRLEAVISQADRDFSRTVLKAWKQGAGFDSWDDRFKKNIWFPLLDQYEKKRKNGKNLPWAHLDWGFDPDYMKKEYERAKQELASPVCADENCRFCGLCSSRKISPVRHKKKEDQPIQEKMEVRPQEKIYHVKVVYSKKGMLRYVSHLDLVNLFDRVFNACQIPIRYSSGFSPHKKISFYFPLPLGIESLHETLIYQTFETGDLDKHAHAMNAFLPDGLDIESLTVVEDKKSTSHIPGLEYKIRMKKFPVPLLKKLKELREVHEFELKEKSLYLKVLPETNPYKIMEKAGFNKDLIVSVLRIGPIEK